MKKLIFIFLVGLCFSAAQAQTSRFGFKAGVNYSNVAGDLEDENVYNSKIGFHGGLAANLNLIGRTLTLQPELLYSQKGYNYLNQETTVNGIEHEHKGKRNFSYLDLPVMLKLKAGLLFVEAGPQVSYLVGIQDRTEKSVNNIEDKDVERIPKGNMKEWEAGYVAGAGLQAGNGLSLGVRYNGRIDNWIDDDSKRFTNARHSVLQVQLGWMIDR